MKTRKKTYPKGKATTEHDLIVRAGDIRAHAKDGLAAYVLRAAKALDVSLGNVYQHSTFPEEFWQC